MSRLEDAKQILEDLRNRAPDVEELALARTNGLIIVSLGKSISQDKKSERLMGAMASALFSISKRAASELLNGEFKAVNVEIDKGNIFLVFTGKIILITLTKPEPNLGLITLELEDAAAKLNNIFP